MGVARGGGGTYHQVACHKDTTKFLQEMDHIHISLTVGACVNDPVTQVPRHHQGLVLLCVCVCVCVCVEGHQTYG